MGGKSLEEEIMEILASNLEKRKLCDKRGYHRIEKEPETENSALVCYDCHIGFDRRTASLLEIEYMVESREKM